MTLPLCPSNPPEAPTDMDILPLAPAAAEPVVISTEPELEAVASPVVNAIRPVTEPAPVRPMIEPPVPL